MQRYSLAPIDAACPVCRSQECALLYTVDAEQAGRHVAGDRADHQHFTRLTSHIQTLWQNSRCRFVRCGNCGFCFAVPYVAGDATFYSLVYAGPRDLVREWEFRITLEALRKRISCDERQQLRLLDIGAGDGSFVKRVSPSLTPRQNVLCVEYSESGANEIRRYGIECFQSDIRLPEFARRGYRFDAICMFHVLEHMDDLDRVFQSIGEIANRDADLFIAVPNAKQRETYDHSGAVEDIPPTHIGRWNKKCFEIMAERHGWVLVSYEIEPQRYLSKIRRFLYYQVSKTDMVRPLRRIRSRSVRRLAFLAILPIRILLTLPAIIALAAEDAGTSQYAHLRRSGIASPTSAGTDSTSKL
jgi:2-polyprenyl-3-methyl-5-hydroxy-6-metoxy-1,4-benzoquinol methylase